MDLSCAAAAHTTAPTATEQAKIEPKKNLSTKISFSQE
jgi:hypothetical protein